MAADSLEDAHGNWVPSVNPWIVAVSVMLATFMVVLDSSVANVALPHLADNLPATTEESTWVLTSHLVSNAIVLPASGWLASMMGRRRLLMLSIAMFTVSSLICGAAVSMPMLILARVLQGAGGGGMQPIAQAILLESFPAEKRGAAMAAYGMGVVARFAPTHSRQGTGGRLVRRHLDLRHHRFVAGCHGSIHLAGTGGYGPDREPAGS